LTLRQLTLPPSQSNFRYLPIGFNSSPSEQIIEIDFGQ
jgi:hypothetical protein